jgi:hypothetical protein
MTAPGAPNGQRDAAMAQIGNCLDLMEITLPQLGAETEEGQAVMDALRSLAKVFGKHRSQMQELQPAQMQMMLRGMPGMGGPPGGMPPGAHPGMPPGGMR